MVDIFSTRGLGCRFSQPAYDGRGNGMTTEPGMMAGMDLLENSNTGYIPNFSAQLDPYGRDACGPNPQQQQQMLQMQAVMLRMLMTLSMMQMQMMNPRMQGQGGMRGGQRPNYGGNYRQNPGVLHPFRQPYGQGNRASGSCGPNSRGFDGSTVGVVNWALDEADKGICERSNQGYISSNYCQGRNESWCADFVSTAFERNGGSPWGHISSVDGLRQWGIDNGRYIPKGQGDVQPGDVMIQKDNGASHTGIVTAINRDASGRVVSFETVEGNSSDAVRRRTHRINEGKLSGFVRP